MSTEKTTTTTTKKTDITCFSFFLQSKKSASSVSMATIYSLPPSFAFRVLWRSSSFATTASRQEKKKKEDPSKKKKLREFQCVKWLAVLHPCIHSRREGVAAPQQH